MEITTMTNTTRTANNARTYTMDRFGTLNRMLEQVLPEELRNAAPVWVPALEVAERSDAYLIAVDLPGVREDQLELNFENNVLTLRGTKMSSFPRTQEGTLRLHLAERQTGAFERSVRLPEFVEGDRIEAQFVDGVLHVTVPKSAAAQPRRIPVSGARSSVSGEGKSGSTEQADRKE
jgi:HSP20 family protein